MRLAVKALCIVACLISTPATAGFITMTFEGVGTGTLAGNSFTTHFTVTTTGATEQVFCPAPGIHVLNNDTANIALTGMGTYDFLFPSHTFLNQNLGLTGFGGDYPVADLIWGPNSPALTSWGMNSSIGPISGTGTLLQWSGPPLDNEVNTSDGVLVFDNLDTAVTFKAVVDGAPVPTPASFGLLLIALFLLGLHLHGQQLLFRPSAKAARDH